MDPGRPDPDALLRGLQAEAAQEARGRLKVFFGACAGVGKTYAMLEAARIRRNAGVDVVVGWVETHGRAETEALLEGLDRLQPRSLSYRGVELAELDLDGALERRPALLLVDELAHTNAPGSRHAKRWQDVLELLAAGIDVYTTLNVQHVESLNDVVAQITGITVHEMVPDRVLEQADAVELVDLPPDELLQRLREGRVYVPEQAAEAVERFFRRGNLIALRELALRHTAVGVDAQMQRYRQRHAIAKPWPAVPRFLVLVAPSPYAARLVRAARRLAGLSGAEWIALHVETELDRRLPDSDRAQLERTLQLAERLGGEAVTVQGEDVVGEALAYARSRNVTGIVVGNPPVRSFRRRTSSVVDRLLAEAGGLDVHVLHSQPEAPAAALRPVPRLARWWPATIWTVAVIAACTGVAKLLHGRFADANLMMVYLVGVMLVATRLPRRQAVLASLLAVGAFDFFFVPPFLTFAVAETQYLFTFLVMLAAALVISGMAARVRQQVEAGRSRERRTAALLALVRDLSEASGEAAMARAAVRRTGETLDAGAVLMAANPTGGLEVLAVHGQVDLDPNELSVARWVIDHGQPAGRWTETLPGATVLHMPLQGAAGPVGVLGVDLTAAPSGDQVHLLEALATQTALAIERARLEASAREAEVQVGAERLRNAVLSAVSHDLRTPLAAIAGAASSLLDPELGDATRRELAGTVVDESARLNRLIGNILQVTRLESGATVVEKEWQPIEEAAGAALTRADELLGERPVAVELPADLPLVQVDGLLLEQVFFNLLENAAKYTAPDTPVMVRAWTSPGWVEVEVADRGPGLPAGEEGHVFDKFVRLSAGGQGVGLGLTVCRGIIAAHGGTIWAENRPGGGVAFRFRLPWETPPPGPAAELEEKGALA
ncbi:MAG TPA: sensor histidine kinase KdpD [Thermoanaerobaculaceae bacterium]|nr:sensor histidine kinase KdpD [Thermoanaerobaculaceae bacterium]HPS79249.1 sensor histidine kinase KdpD [Thermoanaerobaculaceae bacterium]